MLDHNPYSPPQSVSPTTSRPADSSWVWNGLTIYVVCFVVGILLGFLSRLARPYILGDIHFEALIELGLKLAISVAVLWLASNTRTQRPVLRFTISVLALWLGSAIGWSILNGSAWADHLFICASGCSITLVLGIIWLLLLKNKHR